MKAIDLMQQSHAIEYRELAESLQDNLFYEFEQLEHLQRMIKQNKYYNIGYLENLIETTHLLLRSMERYSKKREKITVRKAKRGGGRRRVRDGEDDGVEDQLTDPDEDVAEEDGTGEGKEQGTALQKARKEMAKDKEWTETQIAFPTFEIVFFFFSLFNRRPDLFLNHEKQWIGVCG